MTECNCGNKLENVVVSVERKEDRKVARGLEAKHCVKCNTYYVSFEGASFE